MDPKIVACTICQRAVYSSDVDSDGRCCFCQPQTLVVTYGDVEGPARVVTQGEPEREQYPGPERPPDPPHGRRHA